MVLAILAVAVTTPFALAANPHFVDGPDFSVRGSALTASGKIAGVGHRNLDVILEAIAVTTCRNRGNNVPPGQTDVVRGAEQNLEPKNGQVTFRVTTGEVQNPCPDDMRPQTTFIRAVLTVIQAGKVVLQEAFEL
jgi:hypothetical protein